MKRRDILRGALAATGAGALPAAAQQHAHQAGSPASPAAVWKPRFLDTHQNATIIALTDLIIPATDTPGAKAARVNEYIDLMLHDGPADRRNRFLEGIGELDGHALRQHRRPFVQCTREEQTALLSALENTNFFRAIKGLTVQGYYTSKIGIDELNKGGRVPATYGCVKGDH